MSIYEEIEIEDLDFDPITQIYTYPCPCGDKFTISLEALYDGEDIATCPSCTLRIEIIYDESDLPPLRTHDDDDDNNDDNIDDVRDVDGEMKKQEPEDEEEKKNEDDEMDEIDKGLANIARKSLSVS
jgi:diphthamide biosynthesis protein 3